MSFDILALRALFSAEAIPTVDPFSGQTVWSRQPVAMSEADLQAIQQLFVQAGAQPTWDVFVVDVSDGGQLEVSCLGPTGCSFALRRTITPAVVDLLFQVAQRGDFFFSASMPRGLIVLSHEQLERLPPDVVAEEDEPVVCETLEALGRHLGVGVHEWASYRGQVAG